MQLACESGNIDVVKYLLSQNSNDVTPYSILYFTFSMQLLLCLNGTALYYAVKNKHTKIVRLLLQLENIDVNAKCISK